MNKNERLKAFTLVEAMVAVSISALACLFFYSNLETFFELQVTVVEEGIGNYEGHRLVNALQYDLMIANEVDIEKKSIVFYQAKDTIIYGVEPEKIYKWKTTDPRKKHQFDNHLKIAKIEIENTDNQLALKLIDNDQLPLLTLWN